jgi:uncharacterized repeat protein (TIGR01451 family)
MIMSSIRKRLHLLSAFIFLVTICSSIVSVRAQDCDDNAVIRCGINASSLVSKYNENQGGNVQAVFAEFGIPDAGAMQGMVSGRVTSSNEVFIGDKLVATNALTAGRQNIPGSTPILNGQFYRRPPSVSFQSGSLSALVKMDGETFKFAIIESCGNPVTATDVPNPPPPPEQPKVPNFQIIKDVRVHGQTAWVQDVQAKPGDRVEYRATIRNTGETDLANVMARDVLPAGVTFVDDSLHVNNDQQRAQSQEDSFFGQGLNIGNLPKGGTLTVSFAVTVNQNAEACGSNRLRNRALAKPENQPEKEDDATVSVCKPQQQPSPPAPAPTSPPSQPTPTVLPNTGVGAIAGVFSLTTVLGGALYKLKEFYSNLLQG